MELDFALPVAERAIAGVCSIRNAELRVIFVGEQVRDMGFERTVGATETLVRVVPSLCFWMDSFLCEKRLPAFVPGFESFSEALPVEFCELESKGAEFLCSFCDGVVWDVLLHRLNLVELAELDGETGESMLQHRNDSLASIDDEAGERMSCCEERIQSFLVMHDLLGDDLLPVEVPAVSATHEDAVTTSEECRIHNNDDGVQRCFHLTRRPCVGIEILAQCLRMFAVLPPQLCVRLLVCRVLVVGLSDPVNFLKAALLKLLSTIAALVPLTPPALTVFLCAARSSSYSAKSALKTGGEDKKAFSVLL